ncbi:MAG: threonine/serine dehydratase [Alphaproteobacteria bacterium]
MTVGLEEIRHAAERIAGKAVRTPLLGAPLLDQRLGCRVLVKAESLQLTGSFKFRGAYNRIAQLTRQERDRGVVAYSTGNHAQGVAAAARTAGTHAVIVVPNDIPAIKKRNTQSWGAELAFYERDVEDRVAIAKAIADERHAVIVPPFDDDRIIAGQGTIGLELAEQAEALGVTLDAVVIPCGGGGLSAGIATAVKALSPETRIYLVEPSNYDDTLRSMAAGDRIANDLGPGHGTTICDALTAEIPGELTFPINQRLADGVLAIDDNLVADGLYAAFADLKLVLEPSGAIALAALVTGALGQEFDVSGKSIAVIGSGGNVDPLTYRDALQKGAQRLSAQ